MALEKKGIKRLHRLIKAGIRTAEDAMKYSEELKLLADTVMSGEVAKVRSRFFKALGDEKRLRILSLLQVREMCVCELMVAMELTQPTASHHLQILEYSGLVKRRKEGKWAFYSIADPKLLENLNKL